MSTATDALRYRQVIGHFATGVAIVTCYGPDGPSGLTTNAITSVSLDPLLLLVCFDNGSRTLPAVREAGRFAVNMLRAGQDRGEVDPAVDADAAARVLVGIYQALVRERSLDPGADVAAYVAAAQAIVGGAFWMESRARKEDAHA